MKAFTKTFVRIAFFSLCLAFSYFIKIRVDQESENCPIFEVEKSSLFRSSRLSTFRVERRINGEWDMKHPVWEFEFRPGGELPVSKFKYGVVPPGFNETVKAQQLQPGSSYIAGGTAPGGAGATEFIASQKACPVDFSHPPAAD
jgi:hypothetical protein